MKHGEIPASLSRLIGDFSAWREKRSAGERIPDRLWSRAAKCAAKHGVNRTATFLSLDYYSLKRRVSDGADDRVQSSTNGSSAERDTFVELSAVTLPAANECTIELEDGRGASMRIHLNSIQAADAVELTRNLWNRE